MSNTIDLLHSLNIKPNSLELYEMALTHPSCNADNKTKHKDYERLEFVGDSVLGFVTADLIFNCHNDMNQGHMSKLRSFLVCSKSLANYARVYKIVDYVKTGHSISKDQLYKSDKILEDVFEALIGAIYLDLGFEDAYRTIKNIFSKDIKNTKIDDVIDAKTRLQEEIQAEYRDEVRYVLISEEGPAHDRTFTVEVRFNDLTLGRGKGKSKKMAEEAAARDALSKRSV